jgi:hypothetical protein
MTLDMKAFCADNGLDWPVGIIVVEHEEASFSDSAISRVRFIKSISPERAALLTNKAHLIQTTNVVNVPTVSETQMTTSKRISRLTPCTLALASSDKMFELRKTREFIYSKAKLLTTLEGRGENIEVSARPT